MYKYFVTVIFIFLLAIPSFGQEKKVIKAKPEKEKKKKENVEKKKKKKKPIIRTKLQRPPLTNVGGIAVNAFSNKYVGFGAKYGRSYNERFSWALEFGFFSVPSDQFYFDPYYFQYVQRNKGTILLLTLSSKLHLPILEGEPNINPYWIFGGGPVLGIQTDWTRTFPGSVTHGYSLGGYTGFIGPGLAYYLGTWYLSFDLYYQFLRFPKKVFGKDNFDGMMFSIGVGKMF